MACNPWHGIFGMEIRASYTDSMYHPQHGNHSMEIRAWSLTAGLSTAGKSRHGFSAVKLAILQISKIFFFKALFRVHVVENG